MQLGSRIPTSIGSSTCCHLVSSAFAGSSDQAEKPLNSSQYDRNPYKKKAMRLWNRMLNSLMIMTVAAVS
eukprot:scaffold396311_cov17-Prasinocladus_malaysianus.AAC.1